MGKIGRPTKCTRKIIDEVQDLASRGIPLRRILDAIGISRNTHASWMSSRNGLQAEYAEAFERGEAKCIVDRLDRVNAAAEAGNVQMDIWLLSHRFSQDFNTRQTVGMDPIEINSRVPRQKIPTEEFEAAIDSWDDDELDELSTRFPHLSWREMRDLYNKHCREDGTQDLKAAESEARRALGQAVDED